MATDAAARRQTALLLLTTACCWCAALGATTRHVYIAAEVVEWDFAPRGNLAGVLQSDYDTYLTPSFSPPRVGNVYRKAVLRGYTDATYRVPLPRASWLGILGPVLRAEIGDTLVVNFFNNASAEKFTLHPHGVLYDKGSEGAIYLDGTSGKLKDDDGVPPGSNYTYTWRLDPRFGPAADDPVCMTWPYHSHHLEERDINTGLMGSLVICKPGTLDSRGERKDKAKDFVLFYHVMDENKSWYVKENARRAAPNITDKELDTLLEDADFQESNMHHGINGLMFDNLQGIEACIGDQLSWHLFSLGNEVDVHNARFSAQTLIKRKKRSSWATLFPAKFVTVDSQAKVAGTWPINCEVLDHIKGGMLANFVVKSCDGRADDFGQFERLPPTIRSYYIAAEEVMWNYAPTGINNVTGLPIDKDKTSAPWFSRENGRPGGVFRKAVYRGYTDATFKTAAPRAEHLGILGPTVRGEVGDVIRISFVNRASLPFTLHVSSAMIPLNRTALDRLRIPTEEPVSSVANVKTSYWLIPSYAEPTPLDDDCVPDYYSSFADVTDIYAGLVGMTQLCRRGTLHSNGTRRSVDREFYVLASNMNENESPYFKPSGDATHEQASEDSNIMYALNGLCFNNLPGLNMKRGDRVAWSALCVGTESDVHVLHLDGLTVQMSGSQRDTVELFPGVARSFNMIADAPAGNWDLTCRTNTHYRGGMRALMVIDPGNQKEAKLTGKIRTHYIAAVEEDWNYAPVDLHPIFNKSLLEVDTSRVFVIRDDTHIGTTYRKALFREYTDATFATPIKTRPIGDDGRANHVTPLGMMGPLIRAEVGDTVRVIFLNRASRNYSMAAHGVMEHNSSIEVVEPNQKTEYHWPIRARNGPGINDFDCITWAYYSALDPVKDINTGLVGPLIVCRAGTLDADGNRAGFRHEVPLMFSVMDENESWYLSHNIKTFCKKPNDVDPTADDFIESNKMHSINGLVYGNLHDVTLTLGQRAAIYVLGFGNEVDIHTVHFHGETFLRRTQGTEHRTDVTEVFPSTFASLQLTPTNPGHWLLHCHVNDHMEAGMMTVYQVAVDNAITTVAALANDEPTRAAGSAALGNWHGLLHVLLTLLMTFLPRISFSNWFTPESVIYV